MVLLNLKVYIDQETYEQLVDDAVNSPESIPQRAGTVLRRAYGLPPRAGTVIDLNQYTAPAAAEAVPA